MPDRTQRYIWIFLAATGAVAGCGDIIAPNTDLGLSVWAEVVPNSVSVRDTGTVLRFRVYADNESWKEVRVVSGGPPYGGGFDPSKSIGLWGAIRIAKDTNQFNAGPNVSWFSDSVYVFAPRSLQISEYSISLSQWQKNGWPLIPGDYRVRGWFNTREGKSATLTLLP